MVREADGWDFQWGVINKKGKEVVKCKYDNITNFSEKGVAIVSLTNIWGIKEYGLINTKGKEVIKCIYKDIKSLGDGYYYAKSYDNTDYLIKITNK